MGEGRTDTCVHVVVGGAGGGGVGAVVLGLCGRGHGDDVVRDGGGRAVGAHHGTAGQRVGDEGLRRGQVGL